MRPPVFLLFCLVSITAYCQKIENTLAAVQRNKIIVTYDLSGAAGNEKFDVALYSSHDNYAFPVKLVSGDVGLDVPAGRTKRIEWNSKAELGNYKGELSFEVRAEVVTALTLPMDVKSVKRGKSLPLTWTGGHKSQEVKIELLKSGISQTVLATVANHGSYQWGVPSSQKPGKDYQVRFTTGKEIITSDPFSIKHKIPTLIKAVSIGTVAILALSSGSSSSSGTATRDSNLPVPPDLGLN